MEGNQTGAGQNAHDRPDLSARVFHVKKKALLTDVTKHMTIGKVIAHLHVRDWDPKVWLTSCARPHLLVKRRQATSPGGD